MERNGLLGRPSRDEEAEEETDAGKERQEQASPLEMFGTDLTKAAAEGLLDHGL